MEQSDILPPENSIYPARAIGLGTLLGGLLVAGYLIAANYKAFNEPGKAKTTWIYSILVSMLIFGALYLIPTLDKIPRFVIPLSYTLTALYLVQHYQSQLINSHIYTGGPVYKIGRTFVISLVGTGITILALFLLDTVMNIGVETKTYGLRQHEITYKRYNISEAEVDQLADALTSTFFFDETAKKMLRSRKYRMIMKFLSYVTV
ncbi:hypothetical protein [Adhaeribacter radiodurans]|uniref:Uncharacterized protein n=1 Tax=Adhaeribacter radiodurans TaxID=2745197 RepID=A0A7L7L2U1_9BACT|nr:hypothetical protein [Adhaeribacter radiodurans]QMU27108.1 hypothetical protein HUW48_03260 [Adhaeribacter radiodurans]